VNTAVRRTAVAGGQLDKVLTSVDVDRRDVCWWCTPKLGRWWTPTAEGLTGLGPTSLKDYTGVEGRVVLAVLSGMLPADACGPVSTPSIMRRSFICSLQEVRKLVS
jgi:hypothetical protein